MIIELIFVLICRYDFDVALLEIDPFDFAENPSVTPICIPDLKDRDSYDGWETTVIGWGMPMENAGSSTRILQKLNVPVISTKNCDVMMEMETTPRMLCAGFKNGVQDACMVISFDFTFFVDFVMMYG